MKKYNLTLNRSSIQVFFLMLFPTFSLFLFFGVMLYFIDFFQEAQIIWPTIVCFLVLVTVSCIYVIKRYIEIKVTVEFDEHKFILTLPKHNLFYKIQRLECVWANFKGLELNMNTQTKRNFIAVKLDKPQQAFMLTAKEGNDELQRIYNELHAAAAPTINATPAEPIVTQRPANRNPWTALLAQIGIIIIISFGLLTLFTPTFRKTEYLLKLFVLLVFMVPLVFNYFANKNKG